jgi:hypothetical protein
VNQAQANSPQDGSEVEVEHVGTLVARRLSAMSPLLAQVYQQGLGTTCRIKLLLRVEINGSKPMTPVFTERSS